MTGQDYSLIIGAVATGVVGVIGAISAAVVAVSASKKAAVNEANVNSLQRQADNHETRLTSQDAQLTTLGPGTTVVIPEPVAPAPGERP